jgi:hypothetical protein|tara:strand:+ start:770 stop:979 length:210 start_codon:yes stop_codon:yes gene_type:complete
MNEEKKTMKQMLCPKCFNYHWSFIGYFQYESRLELIFVCNGCGMSVQTDYLNNANKLKIIKKKRANYFG